MEACGSAQHHWGRLLRECGHEVKLIAVQFVRPFVKEQDRRGGCGGDLRGAAAAWDAIRGGEERGAAGGTVAAPHPDAGREGPDDAGAPDPQPDL
jgi:hypothetical protein